MTSAVEYNAETYFFVISTLDKCALMNYVLNINEYNKLIEQQEQDDLIRRYDAGELFNDEEAQEYFQLGSNSDLDLDEPEYPLTQEWPTESEHIPPNFDADAFFDLSDLPEFNLDEL